MTTPNLPELKRLNIWVQEQDKLEPGAGIWHQGDWVSQREETPMCQSAYCVAGMAIVRAGHTLHSQMVPGSRLAELDITTIFLDGQPVGDWGNSEAPIVNLAAELLGIDLRQAQHLFRGSNGPSDIDRVIRGIFLDAGAVDYDAVEPAPDLEIEIKATEAVRPQLLPNLINV